MNKFVNLQAAERLAHEQLTTSGFLELGLDQLELPQTNIAITSDVSSIPYQVYGDPKEAKQLAFAVLPFSTRAVDDSSRVRLAAQQLAAGEEVCVIGVQATGPEPEIRLDIRQRDQVAQGNFLPLAERVMSVVEAVKPRDDQEISLYGFSLGADIVAETAYQNATSDRANFGIRPIERLTVVEAARHKRAGRVATIGAIKTALAFGASGEDLFTNVLTSDSHALLEARGIDLHDLKAEKHHDQEVAHGVARYILSDLAGNVSLAMGLGREDMTLAQLNMLSDLPDGFYSPADTCPTTIVGRASRSTICPPDFLDNLEDSDKFGIFTVQGDHSIADNLFESAAFMVLATRDL